MMQDNLIDLSPIYKAYENSLPYQKIGKVCSNKGAVYEVNLSRAVIGSNVEFVTESGRKSLGDIIVGLGETEQEMIATIQRAQDLGAHTHLFSFFPESGTAMDDHAQPTYSQYRRVQLARYIINQERGSYQQMDFNAAGQVVDFGVATDELIQYGEPFMTSGCPGPNCRVACNRPFGNERPGRPIRNYAFMPEPEDVALIRYQLNDYGE